MLLNRSPSWRQGRRTQPINQSQDVYEQPPLNRDLGKLERYLATVPDQTPVRRTGGRPASAALHTNR